jgi:S-adenosyl-L-methionine hydrolase (adenosine-forming)
MQDKAHLVGLLTDFGLHDHYVGVMKAVIESLCTGVRIVDMTHDVEPQNVSQGAYFLWASYRHFPAGSVIVAVVDPGVGGKREIIGVKTSRHTFLAPNNGLLDLVLWEEKVSEVTTIRFGKGATRSILPRTISSTFHGRDVFAPIAAHLAQGTRVESLGAQTQLPVAGSPFAEIGSPGTKARVLHIDRFGTVVTNIRSDMPGIRDHLLSLRIGKRRVHSWVDNYESIAAGKAALIVGSSGLVEIVMNRRRAASYLGLKQNDELHLEKKDQR